MASEQVLGRRAQRPISIAVVALAAASSVLLLGLTAARTPAAAQEPGTNGRIAFARFDPAQQDDVTFTANPDGSDMRPLLPGFTSGAPHWSPDGREVAVISGLGAICPPTCVGNTVIVNPASGAYRVLGPQGFPAVSTFCSIWSPDAGHFACEGGNDDDASVNGIYTIRSSDGAGLTRITDAGGMHDIPIDYSPDGRHIVFGRVGENNACTTRSALYVVNIDGTGLRRITPWGFCDDDGSWSPDGRQIAFVKPNGALFVVHPDGTGLAQIQIATHSRSFAGDVSWSPDGTKMVFILAAPTGSHSYQEGIATADADGTDVRFATVSPTFDHSVDWGSHAVTP